MNQDESRLLHLSPQVSSLILLSVGTHGNTRAALHALWQRDVTPYLDWLKSTSGQANAANILWLDVHPQVSNVRYKR